MGCDIHFYVEYREQELQQEQLLPSVRVPDDTPWAVDLVPNKYYDPSDEPGPFNWEYELRRWYDDRDYSLFYRLAGVRGYQDEDEPIDDPRGIPEDACPRIKEAVEAWGGDGHSHSYYTGAELSAVSWEAHPHFAETVRQIIEKANTDCGGDLNRVRAVFWFDN